MEHNDLDSVAMSKATSCWPSFPSYHGPGRRGISVPGPQVTFSYASSGEIPRGSSKPALNLCKEGITKVLPFEFRALEVCLESACRCLESEVCGLLLKIILLHQLVLFSFGSLTVHAYSFCFVLQGSVKEFYLLW